MFAFAVVSLAALSLAAFAYAGRLALAMVRERAAMRDRVARAVRPVEGAAIRFAPAPVRPRLGDD